MVTGIDAVLLFAEHFGGDGCDLPVQIDEIYFARFWYGIGEIFVKRFVGIFPACFNQQLMFRGVAFGI